MRVAPIVWGGIAVFIFSALGTWFMLQLNQTPGLTDVTLRKSPNKFVGLEIEASLRPTHLFNIEEGLERPLAVVASEEGEFYVADGACRCVRVFNAQRVMTDTLGPEVGEETIQYPVAVALDDLGTLYVSDLSGGNIKLFNGGDFQGLLKKGDIPRTILSPAGIIVDDGLIYVNDLSLHQVLVFNLNDGALVRTIGAGKGTGAGHLDYPNFSLLLRDGSLLVADSNNNRLQVFGGGKDDVQIWLGPVSVPRGMAMDEEGNIHVASTVTGRIEVFSPDGHYQWGYADLTEGRSGFSFPTGIAIRDGKVYIADRANGRVEIGAWP